MQVNSQLMEAIQQKVELSQQLEEWKTDMEQLLEGQIRERLVHSEGQRRGSKASIGGVDSRMTNPVSPAATSQQTPSIVSTAGSRLRSFFHRS